MKPRMRPLPGGSWECMIPSLCMCTADSPQQAYRQVMRIYWAQAAWIMMLPPTDIAAYALRNALVHD